MSKTAVRQLVEHALHTLQHSKILDQWSASALHIEYARQSRFGDYASNAAMVLAKHTTLSPRELAEKIIHALPAADWLQSATIAGPGFINFTLHPSALQAVLRQIKDAGDAYGQQQPEQPQRILLEFVSANPTGPLHIGHGRGAAYGSALAQLLRAAGHQVACEYYVNDAGRQMDILGLSTLWRALELAGLAMPAFPTAAYQGDYVSDMARAWLTPAIRAALPAEAWPSTHEADNDGQLDIYIDNAKKQHTQLFSSARQYALHTLLEDIRDDLDGFGVHFDHWFSEAGLVSSEAAQQAIQQLEHAGACYQKAGALWFRSTDYGDDKDRVLRRSNGQLTYFGTDVAYHLDKLTRSDRLINIWGADHHGYIARVQASLKASGADPDRMQVLLVQFANLYREGKKLGMSTRSGQFITLRALRAEVGNDATRLFYLLRRCDQHMDFDIDLAKSNSNDNPVYYIQYAHARICSVMSKAPDTDREPSCSEPILALLTEPLELELLRGLLRYPETLHSAAMSHEPHQVAQYLQDLAGRLHAFYNSHAVLVEQTALRQARLLLLQGTGQVLRNGLHLLGLSAPQKM